MSNQNIRTSYIPTSQQKRRDLNKRLKAEQEPSAKKTIVAFGKHASKSVRNFIEEHKEIPGKFADALLENTWVGPNGSIGVKRKKKAKRKKK